MVVVAFSADMALCTQAPHLAFLAPSQLVVPELPSATGLFMHTQRHSMQSSCHRCHTEREGKDPLRLLDRVADQ